MKMGQQEALSVNRRPIPILGKYSVLDQHAASRTSSLCSTQSHSVAQHKSRFPFDVFSAGTTQRRPLESKLGRRHKLSTGRDGQQLQITHKLGSIPTPTPCGRSKSHSQCSRIPGFLPTIRGLIMDTAPKPVNSASFAGTMKAHKCNSMADCIEEPQSVKSHNKYTPLQTADTEKPSQDILSERKMMGSENQRANLELLVRHRRSNTSSAPVAHPEVKARSTALRLTDLEGLQLPLAGLDRVWRTLHTKLRPIGAVFPLGGEEKTASSDPLRRTGHFGQDEKYRALIMGEQRVQKAKKREKEEESRAVEVTFGEAGEEQK